MPQYTVTNTAWTLIASAGASVEVQNLSTGGTRIVTSASTPGSLTADAEVLYDYTSTRRYAEPLPLNLYAIAQYATSVVEVIPIGSGGVSGGYATSGKTAVTGTFSATGQSASFTPLAGRGFNISLYGTFVATVQAERSFDGGTNWLPITAAGTQLLKWTAPASEQWSEDETPVLYRLDCTAWTSGAVNYRVSQ